MQAKFRNCILGVAVGDALGMPAEGISRQNLKNMFGEIRDFLPSPYGDLREGEWTDDTEQMLVLAESILETIYFNPDNFAEKLKSWFLRTSSRRIGPTSTRAIYNLLRGVHWSRAGVFSDTCGAAMRVAPLALVYHFSFNLVENYAEISARVTHTGTAAIGGAVAVAIAISCNLLDFSDEEMLEEVVKRVERYDNLLAEKINYAYEISDRDLDYAVDKIGNSISALDVVPMAFYSYFSEESFEGSVIKAANAGGDSDSIAAICGALKGSRGLEITKNWLEKLRDRELLEEVAEKLYNLHLSITKIT